MADPAVDIASLTEEQQLALQQFTSVTDQDLTAAIPLLQRCEWNAQIAITRFFDGDAGTVDPVAEAAAVPPAQHQRQAENLMHSISSRRSTSDRRPAGFDPAPRVVPTPESQMTQSLPFPLSILFLPVNLTYTIFQRLFGLVGYFLPIIPRTFARLWSGRASRPSPGAGRRHLTPRDTAARFMREFEEEYGVTHGMLPFHEGSYAQAFDIANRELKFLVVVILSPEHDDNAVFVRETLLSAEFMAFVQDPGNNIILWAGTIQDAEAYQVSTALKVTRLPYTCLIVHTPSVSSTAMSKISTSAGPVVVQDLIAKFRVAMQSQSEELANARRRRQEQQATRNLRQEQESAYERSLAQDREKARKRKEEEAEREKVEREEREKAEQKADLARKLSQWRRWRAQSIAAEPSSESQDAVRISIRLGSGERVIRRFHGNDSLEHLYAFVECHDILGELYEKEASKPETYEHVYGFRLVSPMPREVYDLEKGGSIRDRIGRSGNLIVERIIDDDDDDDEGDENGDQES